MADIVVCGGSVIGLSTAMMLADDGHRVTVLEQDDAPVPDRASDAWDTWERRGVAQFHQPHNLFARARQVFDDELPGITEALLAAGCVWVDPLAGMPPFIEDRSPRPDDDRLRYVTGRRPVIEATVAIAASSRANLRVRRGVTVAGLVASPATSGGPPHVTGVRLDDGDVLSADLVIDATGRRSKLGEWLSDIGAAQPEQESEDSGFVYYTRFFTGPEMPGLIGPPQMPLGTVSILTLFGDNDTWSVTVWAASADTALRGLRDADAFTRVVQACPLQAHWLNGTPITDVLMMAGVMDKRRRLVVDGQPVVTGVVPVGDAWACTNPSAGRGISVGLLHAQRLRHSVRTGLDDPAAFVRRFDAATETDVAPFFHNQVANDRARIAQMNALRNGEDAPATEPMTEAFGQALLFDADVFRAAMESVTCLALPQEILARPGMAERIAAHAGGTPMPFPGPSREHLLQLIG